MHIFFTKQEQIYEKTRVILRLGSEALRPQCVLDYNQMGAYYSPRRKVTKWYEKAAFQLLLG